MNSTTFSVMAIIAAIPIGLAFVGEGGHSSSNTSQVATAYDKAYRVGSALQGHNIVTSFTAGRKSLDLSIGSMLPGDARTVASVVCSEDWRQRLGHAGFPADPVQVRVFLVVGDRPAAVCTL